MPHHAHFLSQSLRLDSEKDDTNATNQREQHAVTPTNKPISNSRPETCRARWLGEEYEPGLVSVIMPAYNHAGFLPMAMDSVLAQTYRPIELIVVDDGSTDNSYTIIKEWAEKKRTDDGFRLLHLRQKNKGACAARNLGALRSCGQLIQFLDADDLLAEDKIERQVGCWNGEDNCLVFGPWKRFRAEEDPDANGESGKVLNVDGDILAQWLNGWWAPLHSLLWPRTMVAKIGPWDEQLASDQDGDFFVRALFAGARLLFCGNGYACGSHYLIPPSVQGRRK